MAYYAAMLFSSINIHEGTLYDYPPTMLFAAKANNADSPSSREILNMSDEAEKEAWVQAMYLELDRSKTKEPSR